MSYFQKFSDKKSYLQELRSSLPKFTSILGQKSYPCLFARSTFHKKQIRYCIASSMQEQKDIYRTAAGLEQLIQEKRQLNKKSFLSFMVVFQNQKINSERDFEKKLWQFLYNLHLVGRKFYQWSDECSNHTRDKNFSFSFAEKAFFIVGLNPTASRKARRFPYPALVFNLKEQFDQLRKMKKFSRVKTMIRKRDRKYSGSINPMVQDFGKKSEVEQYSGVERKDKTWFCPIQQFT